VVPRTRYLPIVRTRSLRSFKFVPGRRLSGNDARPILLSGYRKRRPQPPPEGRLGGRAWGMGRGAAPPKFA
jgi:hypothetical protein